MWLIIRPIEANAIEELNLKIKNETVGIKCYTVGYTDSDQVNNTLKNIKLSLSGVIEDDYIERLRGKELALSVKKSLKKSKYKILKFDEIKNITSNIAIFCCINNKHYNNVCEYISSLLIHNNDDFNIYIYSRNSIKPYATIDGIFTVLDFIAYNKSWPWHFDIVFNHIPIEDRKQFTSDFSFKLHSNGKYLLYLDKTSKYCNIIAGQRKVIGADKIHDVKNKVLFLSASRVFGHFTSDEDTIPSQLQILLNKKQIECKVEVFGGNSFDEYNFLKYIYDYDLNENTIVFLSIDRPFWVVNNEIKNLDDNTKALCQFEFIKRIKDYCDLKKAKLICLNLGNILDIQNFTSIEKFIYESNYKSKKYVSRLSLSYYNTLNNLLIKYNINYLNLSYVLNNEPRTSYFYDHNHFSLEGCSAFAIELEKFIETYLSDTDISSNTLAEKLVNEYIDDFDKKIINNYLPEGLTQYIDNLKEISKDKPQNSGVIVMNCNPFTLGHRYLIETASKQVEQLYILVVEEDLSVFKFSDRFKMIKQGVSDLENVDVLPSGQFVISSITFPDYFDKDAKQNSTIDPTMDIEIFCNRIAPALKVKTRFVGEEPLDMVTNQYNQKMADLLPKYDLEFIVIPRKEVNEAPISASRVRKLLDENKHDELLKLVPQTTYDYLKNVLKM